VFVFNFSPQIALVIIHSFIVNNKEREKQAKEAEQARELAELLKTDPSFAKTYYAANPHKQPSSGGGGGGGGGRRRFSDQGNNGYASPMVDSSSIPPPFQQHHQHQHQQHRPLDESKMTDFEIERARQRGLLGKSPPPPSQGPSLDYGDNRGDSRGVNGGGGGGGGGGGEVYGNIHQQEDGGRGVFHSPPRIHVRPPEVVSRDEDGSGPGIFGLLNKSGGGGVNGGDDDGVGALYKNLLAEQV
jgi:hypothetical protein